MSTNILEVYSSDYRLLWEARFPGAAVNAPAVMADGSIIVEATTYSGAEPTAVYRFSPEGVLRWTLPTARVVGQPSLGVDGTIYFGEENPVTGAVSKVYAVNPDGSVLWSKGHGAAVLASPAVTGSGEILFPDMSGRITCNRPDGTARWAYKADSGIRYGTPVIDEDGNVYFATSNATVYSLTADGVLRWAREGFHGMSGSLAVSEGGSAYGIDGDGRLVAYGRDGESRWKGWLPQLNQHWWEGPTPAILSDGKVVAGSLPYFGGGVLQGFRGDGPVARSAWPVARRDVGLSARARIRVRPPTGLVFRWSCRCDSPQAQESRPRRSRTSQPQGWTVTVASDGGQWDPLRGRVKFGPYFDDQARDLRYTVVPGPGLAPTAVFSGTAAADDLTTPVIGQREIPLGPAHPADRNPFDGRIGIGEITSYASGWRRGTPWPVAPQEIPISYVTRAGYAWRHGETYWYDLREPTAPVSWKAATDPKGAPRTVGPAGATEIGVAERRVPADWSFPSALTVTLQVDPTPTAGSVAAEERVPLGWRAEEPNEGGTVDDSGRWLRWGPFFDATPRALRYRLVPMASAEAGTPFEGILSVDGLDAAIRGVARIPSVSGVGPGIRIRFSGVGTLPGLEVAGESGADLVLEVSTDLQTWSISRRLVGQGMDRPVQVDLTEDAVIPVRFWRVRR